MYRIDYEDLSSAAEIMYCFMTLPILTRPECTIWSDNGIADTVINEGNGFMSEQEFCERIASSGFAAISCVASTDKADMRRVVLNLMPDMDFMVLNFPASNGNPNEAEKRLLKLLEL